jgi:hypothetical protein
VRNAGQYSKLLVAAAGAALTIVQTAWPQAHWTPAVTATLSALLVYLVPNSPPPPGR